MGISVLPLVFHELLLLPGKLLGLHKKSVILQDEGREVAYKKEKTTVFTVKNPQKCKKDLTPYHMPDTIGTSEIIKDQEESHDTYRELSKEQLQAMKGDLQKQFEEVKAKGLNLDMSRENLAKSS